MNRLIFIIPLLLLAACGSKKKIAKTNSDSGLGDTRTKPVEYIDDRTYLITKPTTDKTYGYKPENPVKVGGVGESNGPLNERRFLNGLLGPEGQELEYHREGSCCAFKTPNGLFENGGLLDLYKVYYTGIEDTISIYINMYDKGDLFVPVGLTAKKNE